MRVLARYLVLSLVVLLAAGGLAQATDQVTKTYGLSLYGDLKYGPGFTHFDYVNPDAPKGGAVRYHTEGTSFDTFNPFALRGVPAVGAGLLYDTLTVRSEDEAESSYGLIAESMEIPADRTWVIYHLRKEARFHDGSPITADDVIWTFDTLREKGRPAYRTYYADVVKTEKLDDHSVKFSFRDGKNRELALILGEMPVLSKAYWSKHDFDTATLDPPLGSGPYTVDSAEPGRSVTYKRVADYWAANLPVNRGKNNFDTIRYDYYKDRSAALQAFKAGEYDIRQENTARDWMTGYDSPALQAGLYKKIEIPNQNPAPMQGWGFNTRRDIFRDRLVREALIYAYDFEWANKTFFYGRYERTKSYFGSELGASGLPGPDELKILEPYRGRIPDEVFTTEYAPPTTDGSGNIRDNLKKALDLLKQAGWSVKGDQLVNDKTGKPFEFEILLPADSTFERITQPFAENLHRIGINATLRPIDSSQLEKRTENFDFDMTDVVIAQSLSPGNEQRDYWTSEAADTAESQNYMGVRDPVVDELVERIIAAPDRQTLIALTRSLDRILLFGYYVVPQFHYSKFNIAYWDKFGRPDTPPKYGNGLDTWWYDKDRAAALDKRKAEIGK